MDKNLVDLVVFLERLFIGSFFKPEVIITEHFDFMHISAALIFEIIPPLPSFDAVPAISLMDLVIDFISVTSTSFFLFLGGFMLAFAIMTPLGTLVSDTFPILNEYYTEITAVVIGILFHISSTIIFESSEGHKFNIAKISMIVLGIVLACFV